MTTTLKASFIATKILSSDKHIWANLIDCSVGYNYRPLNIVIIGFYHILYFPNTSFRKGVDLSYHEMKDLLKNTTFGSFWMNEYYVVCPKKIFSFDFI